jgi:hypothetical protein
MSSVIHDRRLLALAVAAFVGVPSVATARPQRGRDHRAQPAERSPRPVQRSRPVYGARPRVQDHRGAVRPPSWHHHGHVYWPYYYGYWPYYGYYDYYGGYYQPYPYYYESPGATRVVRPPPRPQARVAIAGHVGQLEREDGATAAMAGLALRVRGRMLEGEIELGRRVYDEDLDLAERTLAGNVYLNLGNIEAVRPYLVAGAGLIESDRVFGAIGAGLALPVAPRLTVAGDLRATSIGARDRRDDRILRDDLRDRTVEGRIGLVVDL